MKRFRLAFRGERPGGKDFLGVADVEHTCEEQARRKLIIEIGRRGGKVRRIRSVRISRQSPREVLENLNWL